MAAIQQLPPGSPAWPVYKCLSTEERPRPTVADATLYELDTRRWYVWHAGDWYLFSEPGSTSRTEELLGQLIGETRKIRIGLEHMLGSEIHDTGE